MFAPRITRRRVKIAIGSLITVGVTGIAFAAFSGSGEIPRAEIPLHPAPVELQRLQLQTEYEYRRTFSGLVAAARSSDLGFESPGKIDVLLIDEGDAVTEGQELARLNTRKLEARRRRVDAELSQARSSLKEARNGERKQTIRVAKSRVTELAAGLKLSQSQLQRIRKARALGSITQSELDTAIAELDVLHARLESARARLSQALEGTRREQIEIRAAMVDSLIAALDEIDEEIEDAVLVSPFAGIVARRFVDDGEVVSVGQTIFRIVETGRLEVRAGLTPRAAVPLHIGQTFHVRIGQTKGSATLKALLPELDPVTRTRSAMFSLDATTARRCVVGQVAEIVIPQRVAERGYWLPTSALTRGVRGMWSCFAAVRLKGAFRTDGTALYRIERRDLEVLFVEGNRTFVRGTIGDGEEIVVAGTHRVVPGQVVQRRRAGSVSDRRPPAADAHRLAKSSERIPHKAAP